MTEEIPRRREMTFRVAALEKGAETTEARLAAFETELEVIRGPVALEHTKPVERGALGSVVSDHAAVKKFVRAAVITLATLIIGGASGILIAVKTHYVDQGRALEKEEAREQTIQRMERRLRMCEMRLFAPGATPVVAPDP